MIDIEKSLITSTLELQNLKNIGPVIEHSFSYWPSGLTYVVLWGKYCSNPSAGQSTTYITCKNIRTIHFRALFRSLISHKFQAKISDTVMKTEFNWKEICQNDVTDCNISRQHIATLLDVTCCACLATMLRRYDNLVFLAQTWTSNTQHVTTRRNWVTKRGQHVAPNNVADMLFERLRSFGRSLQMLVQQCQDMLCWNAAIVWPRL